MSDGIVTNEDEASRDYEGLLPDERIRREALSLSIAASRIPEPSNEILTRARAFEDYLTGNSNDGDS